VTTSNSFDWNDDVVERLRQLWAEGHSTAEIGRRFGISKNAVVGKAHRLDLPGRPSPIAKETVLARRSLKHPAVPRLTDVVPVNVTTSTPTRTHPPQSVRTSAPDTRTLLPKPTVGCITPPPKEPSRSVSRRPGETCCWPIGEPGKRTFRFCGVSVASRTPYCPDHARRAYVRRADPSQDSASNA
jgi:GcrA cell cycle regulator